MKTRDKAMKIRRKKLVKPMSNKDEPRIKKGKKN